MLVSSKELFQLAQKNSFAIPATNFIDLDSARTYVETAEKCRKPIILAFAESHMDLISLEEAALIGKYLAQKSTTPVVLHLDHGETEEVIKKAIELGFSSVMIDASKDSIEENIRKTKRIVEYAHARNVVVEAEIGHVGSGVNYETPEETDSIYTEVADAIRFVEETSVDSLAVSIGTAHGFYKGVPKINFERLEEIRSSVSVPLVLHGGSSSGDENLEKCAVSGICKINIFTDFLTSGMKQIESGKPEDYIQLKALVNQGMKETLVHYFDVFHTEEVTN
ncbi:MULTISPECIES: class II fructose-bisphosphate aldolase [Vagococcus]|uniref:Fructose-bisphosphate aldolase class II n=1 Tax=Vagococcus fluvialis bH819 TaxID=1255619 RepID=A0A1X6WJU7_9ENTE|nr:MULTISPECIES: class II fructose-bisphosphate aldolase [Vagococcus]SLM84535.1 Fructose-bisphosphate aldolase class II [Vagococcus fluvialis bH819]HCM90000.1 class II fructose-bisphosphate aldolase [Vagococcus sp.]